MASMEQLKNIAQFVANASGVAVGEAGQHRLDAATLVAEGVPLDHLRYVFFEKLWNPGGATVVSIYESLAGVLKLKDQQLLTQNQTLQIPQAGPSEDMPIMVFRGSGFVAVQVSGFGVGVTTSGVGVQMEFLDMPGGN